MLGALLAVSSARISFIGGMYGDTRPMWIVSGLAVNFCLKVPKLVENSENYGGMEFPRAAVQNTKHALMQERRGIED